MLEAVCILKGIKPVRMKDPASGQMVDNFWEGEHILLQMKSLTNHASMCDWAHCHACVVKAAVSIPTVHSE